MTQSASAAVFAAAGEYLGLKEWPGARHNPRVVEFFAKSGHAWVKDDETPWCAAFVGAVLAECGLQGTGQLSARSYLKWGTKVTDPEPGDVVVFWRGSRDGWQGHVAFFVRWDGADHIIVRGGNQGNQVSDARYPRSRLLGFRRARPMRQSLVSSTTLQAGGVTSVAGLTGIISAWSQLDPTAQTIVAGAAVVAVLGLAWIARERVKKWARGIR